MSCQLRLRGEDFDVDGFISRSGFVADSVWHKGDAKRFSKPDGDKLQHSGLSVCASNADFDDLQKQIGDVIQYLNCNQDQLAFVSAESAIEDAVLDFGIELRIDEINIAIQWDRFPSELLKLAGNLGLDLEVSLYPRSA